MDKDSSTNDSLRQRSTGSSPSEDASPIDEEAQERIVRSLEHDQVLHVCILLFNDASALTTSYQCCFILKPEACLVHFQSAQIGFVSCKKHDSGYQIVSWAGHFWLYRIPS